MLLIISQLLIVAAAMVPLKFWRGIRAREEKAPVTVGADVLYNR
jgi:hypothetical protein